LHNLTRYVIAAEIEQKLPALMRKLENNKGEQKMEKMYAALFIKRDAEIKVDIGMGEIKTKVEFSDLFDGCVGVLPIFESVDAIKTIDENVQIIEISSIGE